VHIEPTIKEKCLVGEQFGLVISEIAADSLYRAQDKTIVIEIIYAIAIKEVFR
jgi:hypothetical protein